MFDLKSSVQLEEVVICSVVVDEEFDCSSASIVDELAESNSSGTKLFSKL